MEEENKEKTEENGVKRNNDGTFAEGTSGGPGRPSDTPEKIIEKKAIKEIVKEYKEKLAEALPNIEPVLVSKAISGDIPAIKEVHDRVMGKSRETIGLDGGEEGKEIITIIKYADREEKTNNSTTPLPTEGLPEAPMESI